MTYLLCFGISKYIIYIYINYNILYTYISASLEIRFGCQFPLDPVDLCESRNPSCAFEAALPRSSIGTLKYRDFCSDMDGIDMIYIYYIIYYIYMMDGIPSGYGISMEYLWMGHEL